MSDIWLHLFEYIHNVTSLSNSVQKLSRCKKKANSPEGREMSLNEIVSMRHFVQLVQKEMPVTSLVKTLSPFMSISFKHETWSRICVAATIYSALIF